MDRYQKIVSEKAKNKRLLLGSTFFPRTPVVLIDLSEAKKIEPYLDLLEGMNAIGIHTFVVAAPKKNIKTPEGKFIHVIPGTKRAAAYEGADLAIVLNGSAKEASSHSCVPIAKSDGSSTVDYNPLKEKGNGFYFKQENKWEIFAALIRAIETYQFPYDWQNLIQGMKN